MRIGLIPAGAWLAMTIGAIAQSSGGSSTQDTIRALSEAKSNNQAESAQIAREQTTNGGVLNQLAQQAQSALAQPSTSDPKTAADGQKLEQTLQSLAPEARQLIAQSSAAPTLRAPDPDAAPAKAAGRAADPDNAPRATAPGPAAPAPGGNAAVADEPVKVKPDNDIHITCEGASYFDSKEAIAVFTDAVEVTHPQFFMTCDQLEVYMIKEGEKKPAPATASAGTAAPAGGVALAAGATTDSGVAPARAVNPDDVPVAPAAGKAAPVAGNAQNPDAPPAQQDNSIKQAIGRGRKVVIIKKTETGDQQIGVCRTATYIGESGDVILRDMPLVQRGRDVHYATDPSTYMIIKQNGELRTFGPAKVDIIEEPEKKPATPAATAAAAPAVPVAKAVPVTPAPRNKKLAQ